MSILNTIKEIAEILVLVTVSVFAVSVIIYLKSLVKLIDEIKTEIVAISQNLNTTVTELNGAISDVKDITHLARTEIIRIKNLTDLIIIKFKDVSRKIEMVYHYAETKYNYSKVIVSAILRGANIFRKRLAG